MTKLKHHTVTLFDKTYDNTTMLNHGIHSYPAKFPPQVPKTILDHFAEENFTVFDPFCGSGTTLVEANLKNLNAIGNDINPIALLISKVKTTTFTTEEMELFHTIVQNIEKDFDECDKENIHNYEATRDFAGRDHWFQKNVQFEIELILKHIESCENERVENLLKVTLSDILISVSNQESDTRYAAKNKNIEDGFTISSYAKKAQLIGEKVMEYSSLTANNDAKTTIISNDARDLIDVASESVDIIITSPPYANTYDYYLYHKQRMNWLGFNFKETQHTEIGSRHEFSSKKEDVSKWEEDLEKVLEEMKRVLKANRYTFIIIGDSVINKKLIHIDEVIRTLAESLEFEVVNIESTPLSKNSRKFNKKFGTDKTKMEHIIQLYKK